MTDNRLALTLGFIAFMFAMTVFWHRETTKCAIIDRDPLAILSAPR